MGDEAKNELIRQAETTAVQLEQPATGEDICKHHHDLARGVSLSLRQLVVQAKEEDNGANFLEWGKFRARGAYAMAVVGFGLLVWCILLIHGIVPKLGG
jgi:hypothetical protein